MRPRLDRWMRAPAVKFHNRAFRELTLGLSRGFGCYHPAWGIGEDRRLAWEIVGRRSGGENRTRPEPSGSGSAANGTLRRCAEQIVRFARPNILFYDEHVIDLYHRICALYRVGENTETKEKSHSYPAVRCPPQKTSHETVLFSATVSRSCWKRRFFPWWAHQGLNLGPAV
jgi:hypothetical protein